MSTDTLEFPTIDTAPRAEVATVDAAAQDLAKIDLQAVALAGFNGARAAVATAKATLTGVVHDLSTPTKLADAKSLRNRLIKVPLAEARATSSALKSKLTAVSKAVGAELAAIEADFDEAEKLITPQIDAAQAKLDAEREAARLKEEARVQAHREALAKLAAPAEKAAGPDMTAERIATGIKLVEAIVIDRAAWEEFADQAEEQKAVTLERMRKLHTKALAAEAEALRLAEERAEAARVAEAQRVEAERLAAERAEIERQRAELQTERDRVAAEAQAKADEAARLEREAQDKVAEEARQREEAEALERRQREANVAAQHSEAQDSQQVLKAEPATADATDRDAPAITSPSVGSMGAGQPADAGPVAGVTTPLHTTYTRTLRLGEIQARLAPLSITAEGLAQLGFPAHVERGLKLYWPGDFPAICRAISDHALALASAPQQLAA